MANPNVKAPLGESVNGAGSHPADDGAIYLDLSPESAAMLADWGWINDQSHTGAWDAYKGEYIAVVDKQLRGHGPDLRRLREETAQTHGLRPGRIVIAYIHPDFEG